MDLRLKGTGTGPSPFSVSIPCWKRYDPAIDVVHVENKQRVWCAGSGVLDRPSTRGEHMGNGKAIPSLPVRTPSGRSGVPFTSGQQGKGGRRPHVVKLGFVDQGMADRIRLWIEMRGIRLTSLASPSGAVEVFEDCLHLGLALDGLLVFHDLPGDHVDRAIRNFGREFPLAPIGLMLGCDDLALIIWARARGIALLSYPPNRRNLDGWVDAVLRQRDSRTSDRSSMP